MKRLFLCLLCVSGWSVSSCFPRQYHYVDDPMTWTEAQTYCREKYIDLATVENTEEMDQLMSSVPSDHHTGYVWISLYSKIQWKWSDGYNGSGSDYRKWRISINEPNFENGVHLCVLITKFGLWGDAPCKITPPSVCYRGTQQDPEFVLVENKKSWSDAQRYCRENYVDLAIVRNDAENQKIKEIQSSLRGADWVFIGLYRDPNIFWSDGNEFSFEFWRKSKNPLGSRSVVCGTAYLPNSGKWNLRSCEDRLPFVCYDTGSKEYVIKLRMKPDDPSVDLNDPAVKTGLLRELQEQLKESGLSGVTLKWREQPDRKVFHKEEESSQEEDV